MDVDVIGVQEFSSIAAGFFALDAIVKAAPVRILATRIVTPGRFIVLFTGDVASVEASLSAGKDGCGEDLLDELFIPNLDRKVIPAIEGPVSIPEWDALGIIESLSVTAGIVAADLAAKEAEVRIPEIRLAGGMGGKSTIKVMGRLEDVEASLAAGGGYVQGKGLLCRQVLIPRPHPDIWGHLLKAEREVDEIWK
jgi:microcompartment protein CcmL/EutN